MEYRMIVVIPQILGLLTATGSTCGCNFQVYSSYQRANVIPLLECCLKYFSCSAAVHIYSLHLIKIVSYEQPNQSG